MKLKTEDFSNNKEMLNFSIYSTKSKYYDDSKILVVGIMKDETGGVAIEEFVGLTPKIYLFLVDDINELKRAKDMNKNVFATISHNENKDVLLNQKYLRHLMNRIQSKDYRIGTAEINNILLSSFVDKIYTQNNGYDGFALGC